MEYPAPVMNAIAEKTDLTEAAATIEPALPRLATSTMDIGADVTRTKRNSLAWTDLVEGAALWRLGATLGWLDIKLKYRGSLLGPFWLTISTAVWIGAMGGLYSVLFHQDLHIYLPFLALSLVTWNAIGGLVGDACNTFTQAEGTIRAMRMPFFVHALRVVVRTAISFAHNLPVIVAVFAIFSVWPGMVAAQSLLGFVLWTVDGFAACLLLGSLCARFRDIPPIVGSVMQIAFFITPIVWLPGQLGAHGWWLPYNPFDALLETVRAPLLGQSVSPLVWTLALADSALFCALTWFVFVRVRTRLAYWM